MGAHGSTYAMLRRVADACGTTPANLVDDEAGSVPVVPEQHFAGAATHMADVIRRIGELAGRAGVVASNAAIAATRAGPSGENFGAVVSDARSFADQAAELSRALADDIAAVQTFPRVQIKAPDLGADDVPGVFHPTDGYRLTAPSQQLRSKPAV